MVWSRTATVGPWWPPCPGSDVTGPQAATPAASRPLRIGPAVGLLGGRRSYVDGLGDCSSVSGSSVIRCAGSLGALSPDVEDRCDPWPPAAPPGTTHCWCSLVRGGAARGLGLPVPGPGANSAVPTRAVRRPLL